MDHIPDFDTYTAWITDKYEGKIGRSNEGNICMNVHKRGYYYWEPLSTLSVANWMKHRASVGENINNLLMREEEKRDELIKTNRLLQKKTKDLFYKLYENLSLNDRKTFLKNNKTSWLAKETCSVCLSKTKNKNKCIHHDCCGMCDSCFEDMTDEHGKCKACNKSQLIECPICYDENPVEKMCKSATCSHYICWSCYGKSHHCGHPIVSCPSCRADFVEIEVEDDYTDSDSDLDLDDNMWDGIDIETIQAVEQNLMENDPDSTTEDIITAINMIINTPDHTFTQITNSLRV